MFDRNNIHKDNICEKISRLYGNVDWIEFKQFQRGENVGKIKKNGGHNRTRTCDHYHVKVVLYQLSYATIEDEIIAARS